jgi:hypothetical protein
VDSPEQDTYRACMRKISNYTKDIPGHHGCRGVIGQSSSELETRAVDTCPAITIEVSAKYLAEWENQVVSNRLEEKGFFSVYVRSPQ